MDENNIILHPVAYFHKSSVEKSSYSTAYDAENSIMSLAKHNQYLSISLFNYDFGIFVLGVIHINYNGYLVSKQLLRIICGLI
jgi:hypothetical protein